MIIFNKHNLMFTHYTWTDYAPTSTKTSGKLDTTKFNRNEGNEVLYIINKMISLWDFSKIESCIKMERIIKEKLPITIIKQEDIATWIQINWRSIDFKDEAKKQSA